MDAETKKTRIVPCGSCSLCCHGEAIILHPDEGDDAKTYKTRTIWHPFQNKPVEALQQVGDACVYLSPLGGCSIWERRPVICRSFDCRRLTLKITPEMERKLVKMPNFDRAVFDKGREMLKKYPL